jgi:hypothetical protein
MRCGDTPGRDGRQLLPRYAGARPVQQVYEFGQPTDPQVRYPRCDCAGAARLHKVAAQRGFRLGAADGPFARSRIRAATSDSFTPWRPDEFQRRVAVGAISCGLAAPQAFVFMISTP